MMTDEEKRAVLYQLFDTNDPMLLAFKLAKLFPGWAITAKRNPFSTHTI